MIEKIGQRQEARDAAGGAVTTPADPARAAQVQEVCRALDVILKAPPPHIAAAADAVDLAAPTAWFRDVVIPNLRIAAPLTDAFDLLLEGDSAHAQEIRRRVSAIMLEVLPILEALGEGLRETTVRRQPVPRRGPGSRGSRRLRPRGRAA